MKDSEREEHREMETDSVLGGITGLDDLATDHLEDIILELEGEIESLKVIEVQDTLSIIANDGKVYKFEKPEFGTHFYEILNGIIWGRAFDNNTNQRKWKQKRWDLDGRAICGTVKYNLTPTKPKWYEDESNFPAFITDNEHIESVIRCSSNAVCYDRRENEYHLKSNWRLATKQEVEALHYKDKDQ